MKVRTSFIVWVISTAVLASLFKFTYPETPVSSVTTVLAITATVITFLVNFIVKRLQTRSTEEDSHET